MPVSNHVQRQVHLLCIISIKKEFKNHLRRAGRLGRSLWHQFIEINLRKPLKFSDLLLTLWQQTCKVIHLESLKQVTDEKRPPLRDIFAAQTIECCQIKARLVIVNLPYHTPCLSVP